MACVLIHLVVAQVTNNLMLHSNATDMPRHDQSEVEKTSDYHGD